MATVINSNECAQSAPAIVQPTGTVTRTFSFSNHVTTNFDSSENDRLHAVKIPAGALVTGIQLISTRVLDNTGKFSAGVYYKTGTAGETESANSLFQGATATLIAEEGSDATAARAIGYTSIVAPHPIPDNAYGDGFVVIWFDDDITAADITGLFGSVTYTLQNQERYVAGS